MIRNYFKLAIIISINILLSAQNFSTQAEELRWICEKTTEFSTKGYSQEADTLARQITQQFISPSPEKLLGSEEVDQHLKLELYYAFNTLWNTGKIRNHRIVYDFLSKVDKAITKNESQKELLSTITILSLAAQEYFWNEKSTVNDLRNRIKRDLRYGDFKKSGHKLNVSHLIYLEESDIERVSNLWINEQLLEKLKALMEGFRAKSLGQTFSAILDDLETKLSKSALTKLPIGLPESIIEKFSLAQHMNFRPFPSAGDGMCGENSLFIPTDGACGGIFEGNARYKMKRAILDQANDPDLHRLYLLISSQINSSGKFIETILNHLASVTEPNESAIRTAIEAYTQKEAELNARRIESSNQQLRELITRSVEPLTAVFNQFKTELLKEEKLDAWTGNGTDAFKDQSCRHFNDIIEELLALEKLSISSALESVINPIKEEITRIMNQAGVPRPKKIAERNKLVGTALRSYIDAEIIPGKEGEKAFNMDSLCESGKERYSFLTSLCIPACRLMTSIVPTVASIESLIEERIASIRDEKDNLISEIEHSLSMEKIKILELFSSLPSHFSPDILRDEMHTIALKPGELSGWLPCDAIYTQLWAVVNNLNIFVFSSGETHGRSKLDLMTRLQDQPYTQEATHYSINTSGKHLATVILTSPTARNLYLDKSPGHYSKFISPDDLAAMAREARHIAWMIDSTRYALYP